MTLTAIAWRLHLLAPGHPLTRASCRARTLRPGRLAGDPPLGGRAASSRDGTAGRAPSSPASHPAASGGGNATSRARGEPVAPGGGEMSPAGRLFGRLVGQERAALAQCITLVESRHSGKQAQARELMAAILAHLKAKAAENGGVPTSFRIGLTGPPGAGKSTFIEAFGKHLTESGHKVAVLAVDPSSSYSGGSLLGDQTRMPELSRDRRAYIRASPASGSLGGVARNTNDAIIVCEGAGFNIILVETVGVGQSEQAVADMVDMLVLLVPPAGGDELQGIKRGVVERIDLLLVTKADGELKAICRRAKSEYTSALKLMRKRSTVWSPKVMQVSALTKTGLAEAWDVMQEFRSVTAESGLFVPKRLRQHRIWMWNHIRDKVMDIFRSHPQVRPRIAQLEEQVTRGQVTPGMAADLLLGHFKAEVARTSGDKR